MKRILALILCIMMLASCFVISSSAEGFSFTTQTSYTLPEGIEPLDVTMVSKSKNFNTSGSIDAVWDGIFSAFNSNYQYAANIGAKDGYSTEFEVVGQFESAKIENIVFWYASKWSGRLNNITISLSKDNSTWTTVGTLSGIAHGSVNSTYIVVTLPEEIKAEDWQYVKLYKNGTGWVGMNSCMLMADESYKLTARDANLVNTTYVEGYCDAAAKVWNPDNYTSLDTKATGLAYTVAKFDEPIMVDSVTLVTAAYGNRARQSRVYLSEDGSEWDLVSTMPNTASDYVPYNLACNSAKMYQYIKVTSFDNFTYNWSVQQIRVYGYTAAEAESTFGRLNVKHHSMSVNKHEATESVRDWSGIWNHGNARTMVKSTDPIWVIGEFEQPTYITNISIKAGKYNNMLQHAKVSFSNDLETWVDVVTFGSGDNKVQETIDNFKVNLGEKYKYVKFSKDTYDTDFGDAKTPSVSMDIRWISFYNQPMMAQEFVPVYGVSQQSNVTDFDASILWNPYNTTALQWGQNTSGSVKITGEFATPTVVNTVILHNQAAAAARNNHTSIEMSVDGVTWKEVARVRGQAADLDYSIMEIADNTAYKFVRVKQNNAYTYGLTSVAIKGTPKAPEANTTEADFYGVQTKVDADAWALRLISTVDSLDFKAVGYEIKVTGLDKDGAAVEKFFDEYTQTVYTSVKDNMGTRYAEALGGKYIFTATINGISIEKYAALTFEIKPYVADEKGQKTYGETQTYTFEDGVQK